MYVTVGIYYGAEMIAITSQGRDPVFLGAEYRPEVGFPQEPRRVGRLSTCVNVTNTYYVYPAYRSSTA